jgi:hypothetical protein
VTPVTGYVRQPLAGWPAGCIGSCAHQGAARLGASLLYAVAYDWEGVRLVGGHARHPGGVPPPMRPGPARNAGARSCTGFGVISTNGPRLISVLRP